MQIHTNNDGVLDQAAEDIQALIGELLLDPKPYRSRPITFEPLCSLLNRIILISNPGYEASRLSELVVPMPKQFWQVIPIDSVQPDLQKDVDQVAYFRSLSQTQQKSRVAALGKLSELMRGQKGQGLSAKTMIDAVLGPDAPISERLTLFNMVGMTLVQPLQQPAISGTGGAQIDSPNYNPADAIMSGCQLIAMNYQTNNDTMLGYINIFRKSSYVLKPSGLRLPASEPTLADEIGSFDIESAGKSSGKADTTFLLKYGNGTNYLRLMSQQSSDQAAGGSAKTVLINGERLRISSVSPSISTTDLFNTTGFVLRRSPLSKSGELIMIASATQPHLVITVNQDFDKQSAAPDVYLSPAGTTSAKLKLQSFQPEYPSLALDSAQNSTQSSAKLGKPEYSISFRLYPTGFRDAFYLASVRTSVKLVPKTDDNAGQLTFGVARLPILRQIRVASAVGSGTLRIFAGGVVSLSQSAPIDKGAILAVEPAPVSGAKTGDKAIAVYLRDTTTNKYLSSTGSQLSANLARPDSRRSTFILTQDTDQTTLTDFGGRYLFADQSGTLLFKTDQPLIQKEVKNNKGKIIKPARYGASLGSGKYFQILNSFAQAK